MRINQGSRFGLSQYILISLLGSAQRLRATRDKEHFMLDIVMLALGLGFFVVAIGYTYACERL